MSATVRLRFNESRVLYISSQASEALDYLCRSRRRYAGSANMSNIHYLPTIGVQFGNLLSFGFHEHDI